VRTKTSHSPLSQKQVSVCKKKQNL